MTAPHKIQYMGKAWQIPASELHQKYHLVDIYNFSTLFFRMKNARIFFLHSLAGKTAFSKVVDENTGRSARGTNDKPLFKKKPKEGQQV